MSSHIQGMTFDIYRGTTHDGPGMRTAVFFKGCPLSCEWCHNPEGISYAQELFRDSGKCIGCLLCREACPQHAVVSDSLGIAIDKTKCNLCGKCVRTCPSRAMAFVGRAWSVEELVGEVIKDQDYYESFGGGVTASGGEPLSQYRFVAEFFRNLQERGVHTALDTCGHVPAAAFEATLPFTDCVLYDIKILDSALHEKLTGQNNELILQNLINVADYIKASERKMQLWIRTPLVPGITSTPENIGAIAGFLHDNLPASFERWELCAFNISCTAKYQKLGREWAFSDVPPVTQKQIDTIKKMATAGGIEGKRLIVSGIIANLEK